jgi:hypothetical protein
LSFQSDVVDGIYRLPPQPGEFSIEKLGEMALRNAGKPCGLSELSNLSRFRASLFNALLERQDGYLRRGGLGVFTVASSSSLRVKWASVDQGRLQRRRAQLRACVARWLDSLNDRQYELASGLAMEKLGATRVHVTPPGNEFGIDFLASVPAFTKSSAFISGRRGIRIVGQSKKYADAVSREKLQVFSDCLTSVRNNRAEMLEIIPAWFRGHSAPMLACFVAHSGYQSGARTFGYQSGAVLLDTLDLAEIIGNPRQYPFSCDDSQVQARLWRDIVRLGP